ncbi:nuclear transport factor 2 family protein [Mycolicibacillus parakoreensis]|uniref:Nuclear transport factor 2 family protein n=1 Tax=Mycolicibacillus parakoreensis TaxID=1069221 RepID=A0ABY3U7P8_9MYCO|nr:nuclear transport factor 2 family protein [Mycolicibacillus parakoreensis]MCV7315121.1 nuclear transport factor 2 family protein [Mycolicibacillus parakoreensis]ULN53532.1 nuclear transport factor 2 family protein [Mycolicibacillus parakoreensis]HLR98296.1 nuclear transport factor 2 family protein [Mycolicibacillus parakoreensis]
MTATPDTRRAKALTDTVHRYLDLVATGTAEQLAALYADDATVEDPVGGEVHIGRESIRRFYTAIENAERRCELVTLRVAGNEAAFVFTLTLTVGDHRMRIEPIDVMAFNDDGRIAAMKAYWSPENVTQL